ncbi:hypothetical protein AGLY_008009 [Aphis glycines]|uniref:Uncharacterized protein n=1 Tax=Aphis glycines TaxID=307491 RepID=A0A6G0TMT7_APHGL|nr:hypothetical protein AGLY_008009 [Aphis glycines]
MEMARFDLYQLVISIELSVIVSQINEEVNNNIPLMIYAVGSTIVPLYIYRNYYMKTCSSHIFKIHHIQISNIKSFTHLTNYCGTLDPSLLSIDIMFFAGITIKPSKRFCLFDSSSAGGPIAIDIFIRLFKHLINHYSQKGYKCIKYVPMCNFIRIESFSHFPTLLAIFNDLTLVHFLWFLINYYADNLKFGSYDKQIFIIFYCFLGHQLLSPTYNNNTIRETLSTELNTLSVQNVAQ